MKRLFIILLCLTCYFLHAQPDSTRKEVEKKTKLMEGNLEKAMREEGIRFEEDIRTSAEILDQNLNKLLTAPIKFKDPSQEGLIEDEIENNDVGELKKRHVLGPSQYDSRIEIRDLDLTIDLQRLVRINSKSVCIVIEKDMIHQVTDSIYQLDISATLGSRYKLCPNEAFKDQPVIGNGTAFIINEQTLMTAGHVFTKPVEEYAIIFNFEIVNKVGAYDPLIPIKNIFYPKKIVYNSSNKDIAVFTVDRSMERPLLKYSVSKVVPLRSPVYMLGHPMGLPMKAALNASILSNENLLFFYTSLDAFQGNSGSPVFNLATHEVIGVLVSGELDYTWNGTCNTSTLCSFPYCNGEKVIRIEEIMNELDLKD